MPSLLLLTIAGEQLGWLFYRVVTKPPSVPLLVPLLGRLILSEFLSRQIFGVRISETQIKAVNHFLFIVLP